MTLDHLRPGQTGQIINIRGKGAARRRYLDLGLTPKTVVMVRKVAPLGDPMEISLRGFELTLRKEEAKNIEVEEIDACIL